MSNEVAELLSDWRATYAELFPHRNPEAMRVDDADLALAVLLRREIPLAIRSEQKAAAQQTAASLRQSIHLNLDRLSRHDPRDQE